MTVQAPKRSVNDGLPADAYVFRRRMLPWSVRRAVAIAIELERTHDHLAAYTGSVPPIANRIAVTGSTTTRRLGRLALPHDITAERLANMHADRMAAIEDLYAEIAPTLGNAEASVVRTFVVEAQEMTSVEQRPAPRATPRIRSPRHDGLDANEVARLLICDAADATEDAIVKEHVRTATWRPPVAQPASISIELIVEGLLEDLGIDRDVLYVELAAIRAEAGADPVGLASPSTRSNFHRTLHALGPNFPPATFRLRGASLDTVSLELTAADPEDYYDVWTYAGGHVSRPVLTRHGAMRGVPIHTFSRRTVADALGDRRFHPALVIDGATREIHGEGSEIRTKLSLFPRYTLLDPPGRHVDRPAPVAFDAIPEHVRSRRDVTADIEYERLVVEALARRGHSQKILVRSRYGQHLTFAIHERRRNVQHTFVVTIDTLRAGVEAIERRVDKIVQVLEEHELGVRPRRRRHDPLPPPPQTEAIELQNSRHEVGRTLFGDHIRTERCRTALRRQFSSSFPSDAGMLDYACRIDQFLAGMLKGQWMHAYVAKSSEATFGQEGDCLFLKTALLGSLAVYRLMQVRWENGMPSEIVAQIEVNRILDKGMMDGLEGQPLHRVISWQDSELPWTVRRIERVRSRTVATFNVPMKDL